MEGYEPVQLACNTYVPIDGADDSLAPVVFCHGVGAFKEYWGDIPQNVANATKRRAYTVDARNHGDSEWSDVFNFDIIGDDLLHFLETAGIEQAILVGHSMGGITVIKAALKRPDIVDKLVVEDMFVKKVPSPILEGVVSYFELARNAISDAPSDLDEEDDMKKFVMDYIRCNLPPEIREKMKEDRESEDNHIANFKRDENGRLIFKANMEVIENAMRDPETLMSENEGLYEGPTCFIYGKLSPFNVGEEEEHIRQFFPNAIFEEIEEATHTVHGDRPLEFTDALLKFIS